MKDFLLFASIFVLWIALNRWILPWFGVQTCMSGRCARVSSAETTGDHKSIHDEVKVSADNKTP